MNSVFRFSLTVVSLVFLSLGLVKGDVYLHGMRGSNNRLDEPTAERANADRLFNSQNNNRGGYNVGDRSSVPAQGQTAADVQTLFDPTQTLNTQYSMLYYENSVVTIEWTNQHGCGGSEGSDPHQQNCEIIIQFMCQTDSTKADQSPNNQNNGASIFTDVADLWDGSTTNTPTEPNALGTQPSRTTGLHESNDYYFYCKSRSRNRGLFTADQILNGNTAIFTRQNPNGNRNGLECPEERDYYPYWSPSPWRDIAILTDHVERCPIYLAGSQNTAVVGRCEANTTSTSTNNNYIKFITESECVNGGGVWKKYSHGIAPPVCQQADWSRVNHLGNGRNNQPLTFNWTIPTLASMYGIALSPQSTAKCVLRLRYNISTDDYNPWNTTALQNNNPAAGVVSPVTQNPTIDVGAKFTGLRLAVNTAQFGRTFQDRSHIFYIRAVPKDGSPLSNLLSGKRIINLNVRGKRGNIVQVFPSVEYDFQPNRFHLTGNDIVHIQWTGSNTHNNNAPGGDGQTGDAGEGTTGTDRSNMMQLLRFGDNYPMPLDKYPVNMFSNSVCYNGWTGAPITTSAGNTINDCSVYLATSGFFQTVSQVNQTAGFNPLLNNAPASLVSGLFIQFNKVSSVVEYSYMCTRNNNFSNRAQKGTFVVTP